VVRSDDAAIIALLKAVGHEVDVGVDAGFILPHIITYEYIISS